MIGNTRKIISVLLVIVTVFLAMPTVAYAKTDLKTGVAVVTGSSLRLRESSSILSKVLDKAEKNDIVVVLGKYDEWYKVNYNLQVGYMHEDYLRFIDKENVELGYGKISGTGVNVRKGPSASNKSLCKLNNGAEVYIIGINNGWYKVIVNSLTGYIRSDYVELTEIPYENHDSNKEPMFFKNGKKIVGSIDVSLVQKGNSVSNKVEIDSVNNVNYESAQSGNAKPVENTNPTNTKQPSQNSQTTNSSDNKSQSISNHKNEIIDNGSNEFGDNLVTLAKQYLGTPYAWGGTSPSGFDCSGFVYYVVNQSGFKLSRNMQSQYTAGTPVSREELQPGDLVFFQNTYKPGMSHVGIYVGNGQFIHSPSSGKVVSYASMNTDYYISHYYGACRLG